MTPRDTRHPTTGFRGDRRKLLKGIKTSVLQNDGYRTRLLTPCFNLRLMAKGHSGGQLGHSVGASDTDNIWQADLVDFKDYVKENGGHRYLLTVIDIFSRWGMGEPVRNKSDTAVAHALETVFNRENRMPIKLNTDKGKEFVNPQVNKLLSSHGITLYHTKDQQMKATLVERFNRTLKDSLTRLMIYRETVVRTDKIQMVITVLCTLP